jgi:peptidoglycan/LPS O-acetylase OafA/YrhL
MATETKNESPALLLLLMFSALSQSVSAFSPHRHPVGFGFKFFTVGYLIGVWIWFWRSLAQRFGWPPFARFVIPSALFVLPLTALHTVDKSLGTVPGTMLPPS